MYKTLCDTYLINVKKRHVFFTNFIFFLFIINITALLIFNIEIPLM